MLLANLSAPPIALLPCQNLTLGSHPSHLLSNRSHPLALSSFPRVRCLASVLLSRRQLLPKYNSNAFQIFQIFVPDFRGFLFSIDWAGSIFKFIYQVGFHLQIDEYSMASGSSHSSIVRNFVLSSKPELHPLNHSYNSPECGCGWVQRR